MRDLFINGESMVSVKGNTNTSIALLTQLGLSDGDIKVSLQSSFDDVQVDAWGGKMPMEVQYKLTAANLTMTLVHFDRDVVNACIRESMGGTGAIGQVGRAGTRLGGGAARFAVNNHFIGLNILSPVGNIPWRFYYAYLADSPLEFPLGTTRSVIQMQWRVIPYTQDPWGGGTGSLNSPLWDHVLDN